MSEETEIVRAPDVRLLRELSLVLRSQSIPHRIVGNQHQSWIVVPTERARDALEELANYHRENSGRGRREAPLELYEGAMTHSMLWCALLALMHVLTEAHAFGLDWRAAGMVDGQRIAAGELWRPWTALGLHADVPHLAGNLAFGALFLGLLAQVLGGALTWSTVFLAGGLGNLLNLVLGGFDHRSLGASTAVFAALGVLTAVQFSRKLASTRARMTRFVPLIAGVLLLGWNGLGGAHMGPGLEVQGPTNPNTDIGAHISGFLVGLGAGVLAWRVRHRLGAWERRLIGWGTAAVYAALWGLALLAARG